MTEQSAIERELLRLATEAGPQNAICPTDVAQAVAPEAWRGQLLAVRRAAQRMAEQGLIDILRKGKPVPPTEMRGVIRLRLRPQD